MINTTKVTDIDWGSWKPTEKATLLFVIRSGQILLIHKKRGLGAGKINGPGGRIEAGESPMECAIREVREELRISVRGVKWAGTLSFQFADGYSLHGEVFTAADFDGTPTETDEAVPHWFKLDELPYARMWPDDKLWMPLMLAGKTFDGRFIFDADAMLDAEVKCPDRLKIGVSSCLLGRNVRYDGGNKLDRFLVETLGKHVEYVPVCPEVECGLTVPREAMRLVGNPDSPRLMTEKTGIDCTGRMLTWTQTRIAALKKEDLCGYIFKTKSPSCGMRHLNIHNEKGEIIGMNGAGIWASEFIKAFPLLPVEDEIGLQDPELRRIFIERIFALKGLIAAPAMF